MARFARSVAELERALPSHFLRLGSHLSRALVDESRARDDPASTAASRARREAFLTANARDAALFEYVKIKLHTRAHACPADDARVFANATAPRHKRHDRHRDAAKSAGTGALTPHRRRQKGTGHGRDTAGADRDA